MIISAATLTSQCLSPISKIFFVRTAASIGVLGPFENHLNLLRTYKSPIAFSNACVLGQGLKNLDQSSREPPFQTRPGSMIFCHFLETVSM
jgi:hypothetical protein